MAPVHQGAFETRKTQEKRIPARSTRTNWAHLSVVYIQKMTQHPISKLKVCKVEG